MFDRLRLSYWNLYFIAALGLHYAGHLEFSVGLNLLLAAVLLLPMPQTWKLGRELVAGGLAVALLYHESWWPPIERVASQAKYLTGFSMQYLWELLGRAIDLRAVIGLTVLLGVALLVKRYHDPTRWVMAAMLLPLIPPNFTTAGFSATANTPTKTVVPEQAVLNDKLERFFTAEASRRASFEPLAANETPYDIILLHVCSLAWSDLDYAQLRQHLLLDRFDILFTDFNTVTPYSGPAMIRVLRGSCGQSPHDTLYAPPPKECFTFGHLERIGFTNQLLLNHDGKYGDFLTDIRRLGGLSAPLFLYPNDGLYLKSFDETLIARDYDVISRWWQARVQNPSPHVALYYNSVSLHDGNRYATGELSEQESRQTFIPRVSNLLGDVNRIVDLVESSGRNAILVMLPEHGAAVKGDKSQMAGLREIPSPAITQVPVGVKLIGGRWRKAPPVQIKVTQPSTYLAVSQLLGNFTRHNPFSAPARDLQSYVDQLPQTEFIADSASTFVMRHDDRYFLRRPDEPWESYDP